MKNSIAFLFVLFAMYSGYCQHGKVFDDLTMKSEILKAERKFAIYLPPDYESSSRNYPVLYLLHGSGDDQTGWVQFGEVLRITDKAIKSGKATPMIIVMPDAHTGQRGYNNDISGEWNYEDFFFEELMPHVEKKYRIKKEKRFRAISGLSMGGGGSFIYALHHPELFSSAAPMSAYVGPLTIENLKGNIERNSKATYSDEELQNYFAQYNAVELVKSMSKDDVSSVRWYIDCGDDDFLFEGNSLVHIEMKKREIPHEYRVRDGAHNWTYWRESLPEVLEFISQAFHQY